MAKTTKVQPKIEDEVVEETRTEVAVIGPSTALREKMKKGAGKGVSTDQADNLVPLVYLLQANSPQVQRGNPRYIQGAQAGDIWLRNMSENESIIKCEEGMDFQSCYFSKDVVEWMPNRGGFVARHKVMPEVAEQVEVRGDDGNLRKVWKMPNGNNCVETRYHVGFVFLPDGRRLPYTVPFSSTGHQVSRAWMFQMNSETLDGESIAGYSILYKLTPKIQTKNNNSWYQYTVSKVRWVDEKEYDRGEILHNAFVSGEKEVAEETEIYSGDPSNYEGLDGVVRSVHREDI